MPATNFIFLLFFIGSFIYIYAEKPGECDTWKCFEKEDISPPACGDAYELKNCIADGLKSQSRCNEAEKNKTKSREYALVTLEESYCGDVYFQTKFEENRKCWKSVASCSINILSTLPPMTEKPRDPESQECKDVFDGLTTCQSIGRCNKEDFHYSFFESVKRVSRCGDCKVVASVAVLLLFLVTLVFVH